MSGERELQVFDGWATAEPHLFEFFTRRRLTWGVVDQLDVDLWSWKVWLTWLFATSCIGFGLWRHQIGLIVIGSLVALTYAMIFTETLLRIRYLPLLTVRVMRFDQPHPLMPHLVWGVFEHPVTNARARAAYDAWAVEKLRRPDGSVEALVVFDSDASYCKVVGLRAATAEAPPADSTGQPAGLPAEAQGTHPGREAGIPCTRCGSFVGENSARSQDGRVYCLACTVLLRPPAGTLRYVGLAIAVGVAVLEVLVALSEGASKTNRELTAAAGLLVCTAIVWSQARLDRARGYYQGSALTKPILAVLGCGLAVRIAISAFRYWIPRLLHQLT